MDEVYTVYPSEDLQKSPFTRLTSHVGSGSAFPLFYVISGGALSPVTFVSSTGFEGMCEGAPSESDDTIRRLSEMLYEARRDLEMLKMNWVQAEIPEIFEMHPLSSRRVNVKVRKIEPARFSFIADD